MLSGVLLLAGCGEGAQRVREAPNDGEPQARHVHGLGVNPKDGALFIATHAGLFRVGAGDRRPSRVGGQTQDVMGFTVVGPDRFIASGHPEPGAAKPPVLGLMTTRDAGRTWRSISLSGSADFHLLRAEQRFIYGFEASSASLLVTSNGGRPWKIRRTPQPLLDFVVRPGRPRSIVAADRAGLIASDDAGRTWRRLRSAAPGLLAWPEPDRLYRLDRGAQMAVSRNGGRTWRATGGLDGHPAALAADGGDLYVALDDGTVKFSLDDGHTWGTRATPLR